MVRPTSGSACIWTASCCTRRFTPSKAKGLILDLRFCPGGLLSAAGDVTKLFLAKGTIVTIKGSDGYTFTSPVGSSTE